MALTYTETLSLDEQIAHHRNMIVCFTRMAENARNDNLRDFYDNLTEDHRKKLAKVEAKIRKEDGNTAKKYRKKPVVVEAFRWTGDRYQIDDPEWVVNAIESGYIVIVKKAEDFNPRLKIITIEGTMEAEPGDYIIRGVNGEIYPCKPDIFEKTYEEV